MKFIDCRRLYEGLPTFGRTGDTQVTVWHQRCFGMIKDDKSWVFVLIEIFLGTFPQDLQE